MYTWIEQAWIFLNVAIVEKNDTITINHERILENFGRQDTRNFQAEETNRARNNGQNVKGMCE